jgi:hypothetical protein
MESESIFQRFIYQLNEEPLAGFLSSTLPDVNFDEWWGEHVKEARQSMLHAINWPHEKNKRIALQIELCRSIESKKLMYFDFLIRFFSNKQIQTNKSFAIQLLEPLVRNIDKLSHSRALPASLNQAMGMLPKSGDETLDMLLSNACEEFKDPAPKARAEAVKKLWDAWERLKTLQIPSTGKKKESLKQLLDQAAPEEYFRNCLETEARALTKIGNDMHIRHFEKDKTPFSGPEEYDYLFHRMYALIHFLLLMGIENLK